MLCFIACGYGDPHIYTLDQGSYTYNPIGEFWMIKSDVFSMQCRMIQSLNSDSELIDATQFGAFVMTSLVGNSSVVHLEINNNRTGQRLPLFVIWGFPKFWLISTACSRILV